MKIIITGGVAGGATAAARMRRLNEEAEIIMFEKGPHISFANCGLPYFVGGAIKEESSLKVVSPDMFRKKFNVDVRVMSCVTDIDRVNKIVTVSADGKTYREGYDKLLLSTGAEPVRPPFPGASLPEVLTLRSIDDALLIKEYIAAHNVKHAVVVGGGYIGIEMAENLKNRGLDIAVVEMDNHVIAPIDYDMAADVHKHLRDKGVSLYLSSEVRAVEKTKDGLLVKLSNGEILTESVILSVGVRPDTALAKNAGLEINRRGSIIVDSNMCTSDRDIYAVGDAAEVTNYISGQAGFIPLAGPANKQGRIAADNIFGYESRYDGTQGTAILKVFDLTVACTGISEKEAERLGMDFDKAYLLLPSHARYYPAAKEISVKVIFLKESGKILGAQVIGTDGVDKRCDVFAAAIRFGAAASDLIRLELCYAPPYGSAKEIVNMAGYVIENLITKKVKQTHWHDIAALPRDGSVTLIDVRNDIERRDGTIDGFIHIPLEELRDKVGSIDKNKPVFIHCKGGLKSYNACRILQGHGYDCTNIAGGFSRYSSAVNNG